MSRFVTDDQLDALLAASHDELTAEHGDSRSRLLEHLKVGDNRVAPVTTSRWGYALGGIGVGSVAVALMLVALLTRLPPAAAVERIARAVEQVTSYTYRMEEVYVSKKEDRRVETTIEGRWRLDPVGVGGTTKIWITDDLSEDLPGRRTPTCDIEELHQGAQQGVLVDHLQRQFWLCDPIDFKQLGGGSPTAVIYKVRQYRGRTLRDLGEKVVDGRPARGVELLLDDSAPETDLGPAQPESPEGQARGWDWRNVRVELWYDPATDLPIEFQTIRHGEDFTTTIRYTNLRWNPQFPPDAFAPAMPEGYEELLQSPWAQDN